ncbi:acyltransferase [Enterobacterales bacterium CwR94]|nr:acyltransferase [Enterobacterales bacterium CwR94]
MIKNNTEEILWINTLKGACILLVVLYHVVLPGYAESLKQLTGGFIPAALWVNFNIYLSPLRMPAFFFVSGLLAAKAITERSWQTVFTGRITNLFYLYFLWGLIQWFSIYGIVAEINGEPYSHNTNSMYAHSPIEFLILMFKAMSTSWYLYGLALFFLCTKLFHRQKLPLMVVAVLLNYAAQLGFISGWGPESLSQYFLFFVIGAFYSREMIQLSEWRAENLPLWCGLALLAVLHMLVGLNKSIMLCLLAIAGSIALCRFLNQWFSLRFLNWVGKNTLQIYVLHRIFIELFGMAAILFAERHGLFDNPGFSAMWAAFFPIVMVLLCSACSVGVWTVLNRGPGRSLFMYPRLLRVKVSA